MKLNVLFPSQQTSPSWGAWSVGSLVYLTLASLLLIFACKTTKPVAPLPLSDHLHPDKCKLLVNETWKAITTLFLAYNPTTWVVDTFRNLAQVQSCYGIELARIPECDCVEERLANLRPEDAQFMQSRSVELSGQYAYATRDRETFWFHAPIRRSTGRGEKMVTINAFPPHLDSTARRGIFTLQGRDTHGWTDCDTMTKARFVAARQETEQTGDVQEDMQDLVPGAYAETIWAILQTNEVLKRVYNVQWAMINRIIPDHLDNDNLYDLPEPERDRQGVERYNAAGAYRTGQQADIFPEFSATVPMYINAVHAYQEWCPDALDRFKMSHMNMTGAANNLATTLEEFGTLARPDSIYTPPIDTVAVQQSCFSTTMTSSQSFSIDATCPGVTFDVGVYSNTWYIGSITNVSNWIVSLENILADQPSPGIYYAHITAYPTGEKQVIKISK